MSRYPQIRSAALPALWAVQRTVRLVHAGGHPPGRGGDGGHPRLPGVARDLLRPVPDRPRWGATRCSSATTSPAGCGGRTTCCEPSARPPAPTPTRPITAAPARRTARSSSRASSAWGPATSRRWPRSTSATTGRWTPATRGPRSSSFAPAPRSCRTRRSPSRAGGRRPEPEPDPRASERSERRREASGVLLQERASTSPGWPRSTPTGGSAATARWSAPFASWSPRSCSASSRSPGCAAAAGAGFSMGKKASFLPRGEMAKYLCCNADESEPGAFKDRELMQKNPHQLIEGIAIAALAAGAGWAFIFIRGEYAEVADILDRAVAEAYEAGYLGENILGTGCRVELVVHRGAGAYICGEETALLDSLEGKRGNPRLKPPFPAIQGLYGRADPDQQRRDALQRAPHRRQRRRVVQGVRHRAVARHQGRLGLGLRPAARQLRGRARDPRPGADLRARRRPARRTRGQGLVPGRLLGAGPDRGRARPPLQLRGDGRGGLDARLGVDHRRRRLDLDPASWRCARRASTTTSRAGSAPRAARAPTGR